MTGEASVFTSGDGVLHIRCDAPGERAVSAPITDPLAFIRQIAARSDELEIVDNSDGSITISIPPGA